MIQRYVLRSELNEILAEGAIMAAGVPGGQTLYGGTALGETLAIYSTTNATKTGVLIDNIMIGRGSGGISTNIAIGADALYTNTTGYYNTAVGVSALHANTTGHSNIAIGADALYTNTTGYHNTAVGVSTLRANTTGHSNIAIGIDALYTNTTGYYNTAVGVSALHANTTGHSNIAIGADALYTNTTGYGNTAVGVSAGSSITTGTNLCCIGHNAEPSAADATNEITLGNANIATLRCRVTTITAISDRRDKTNIETLPIGLDFLTELKPVRWNWQERIQTDDGQLVENTEVGAQDLGFVAQDLDELQTKYDAAWLGLVMKANPDRWEATPGKLLPVAIRAIQELAAKIDILEKKLVG